MRITWVGRYRVEDATRPHYHRPFEDLSLQEIIGYERRAARAVLREVREVDTDVMIYARRALGLAQAQLAELLEVTPEDVARWESGEATPRPVVLLALSALLDNFEWALSGGPVAVTVRHIDPRLRDAASAQPQGDS